MAAGADAWIVSVSRHSSGIYLTTDDWNTLARLVCCLLKERNDGEAVMDAGHVAFLPWCLLDSISLGAIIDDSF